MAVSTCNSQSWADFVDEAPECEEEFEARAGPEGKMTDLEPAVAEGSAATLANDLPSIGSAHHKTGRCKPCAFFRTKGCQNGKVCEFCHLCPPGEKQRRKRLREQMCEKLGQCYQNPAAFDQGDRRFKTGHLRQGSNASTGATSSGSGWTKFSHSRQSSDSSVAQPSQEHMAANAHMHPMMPVFHFPQPVMPPSARGAQRELTAQEAQPATTIALAQAVPEPEKMNPNGWNGAGMAPWPPTGMVQYVMVPVPMPMTEVQQQQQEQMCYAGYAPQPQMQLQMAAVYSDQMQWCSQDGAVDVNCPSRPAQ